MEDNIMNEIVEEVMENNEDIIVEACANNGFGKGLAVGLGVPAVGYGLYRLGKWAVGIIKAKKKATIEVPEDISDDQIDEIPGE